MKKIISILAGALFSVTAAFSQSISFDAVCKNLSSHPNMTGNFQQVKTIKAVNRSLKSSGTFIFSLEGIMWKTEKPFPSSLAVGKTSVIQTKADGSKTVIDASQNQIFASISGTLVSLFSGDLEGLKKSFDVNYSCDGSTWKAELLPFDSAVKSVLSSLVVSGNCSASFSDLNQIVMTEATGDTITYTFTDQKYPKELTDAEKAYFTAK